MEGYLREALAHEILGGDEVLEKFLTLNSNDFNDLKSKSDIYDQNTDSSSFLKMPTTGNIKSFYQLYEHAQAYLYTKYNSVIKKKKSCVILNFWHKILRFFINRQQNIWIRSWKG